jgi:hypothetical protein
MELHETCRVSCRSKFGKLVRYILVLLESCLQTCMTYTSAKCTVNKLLMMGIETAQNMYCFMPE